MTHISKQFDNSIQDQNAELTPTTTVWVDAKGLAKYLGSTPKAIQSDRVKNPATHPPYYKASRKILYNLTEVDEHIKSAWERFPKEAK